MIRNWTKFISCFRIFILCFAVIAYGLPTMAMESSDMMAPEMSIDCDQGMTDHSENDMSCCDTGECDYSCASLSVAITNIQASTIELQSQSHMDRFTNHLTSISLTSDSPPPQV